ncbi:MAG: Holliday junction branch migration protein RuvA [Patescibacteria group bacterium]|nr:Holliday junction branch migration protein RuvA [Patescibacteria group bacterium]
MINQLTGQISHQDNNYIILNVSGVGYKIFITNETIQVLKDKNEKIKIWTHLAVRENSLDLYGFLDKQNLDFFEMLITISGIGPKTALGILNVATVETLISAISSKDTSYLTKVSGIGQKNAEKIILELKNKITNLDNNNLNIKNDVDVIEALKTLGYSNKEAINALKKIPGTITDVGDKIKEALKFL